METCWPFGSGAQQPVDMPANIRFVLQDDAGRLVGEIRIHRVTRIGSPLHCELVTDVAACCRQISAASSRRKQDMMVFTEIDEPSQVESGG